MKYRFGGKQKTLALGFYPAVSLSEATQCRDEAKKLQAKGIDPVVKKQGEKRESSGAFSFETVARQWHAGNKKGPQEYRGKILRTLETYLFPVIGPRHIAELKTHDLL